MIQQSNSLISNAIVGRSTAWRISKKSSLLLTRKQDVKQQVLESLKEMWPRATEGITETAVKLTVTSGTEMDTAKLRQQMQQWIPSTGFAMLPASSVARRVT
jgi:hypothetical protein